MFSFALTSLEKAMNLYLGLDPNTLTRLTKLEGKVIQIKLTDLNFNFFILPQKHGIKLQDHYSKKPDTIISGTSFGLFKAGCAQGSNSALFKNSIDIEGDTELGETIRYILSNMDIDWEEHLSKMVGDTVAHKMGIGFRKTKDIAQYTTKTIRENIREYLQNESQCTPTQAEVENYLQDVSILKNDVDRAEARLERILKTYGKRKA